MDRKFAGERWCVPNVDKLDTQTGIAGMRQNAPTVQAVIQPSIETARNGYKKNRYKLSKQRRASHFLRLDGLPLPAIPRVLLPRLIPWLLLSNKLTKHSHLSTVCLLCPHTDRTHLVKLSGITYNSSSNL